MKTAVKKPQKLQQKLYLYFLILPISILSFFAIFFYQYIDRILISREKTALAAVNEAMQQDVEDGISRLDDTSAGINYYNIKTNFFEDSSDLVLKNNEDLSGSIIALNGTSMKADQINIYALDGYGAEFGTITKNISIDPNYSVWFQQAIAARGAKLVGRPYLTRRYSLSGGKADWYVSVYRAAVNRNGRCVGVIETVRRCRILFQSLNASENKEADPVTCVFDEDGNLIYPYDAGDDMAADCREFFKLYREKKGDSGEFRMPSSGEKYTFTCSEGRDSGWTFLTVQKNSVILKPLRLFSATLLAMVGAALVATILMSKRLARSMIRPIKHLKHIVQRLNLSTLGKEKTADYRTPYEELDELYAEFEKMNRSLQASLKELEASRQLETRARAYALQAQMNPHFYYNSLSCISILAEDGMTDEAVRMCRSLSDIMRYITNGTEAIVPLREEIEYIRKYMYCMKIRYQDSLDYSIDIDEKLYEEQIPKLIIQPVVENAVKYGTDCLPPWKITIRSRSDADGWMIEVVDSGNGFPDDRLKEIRAKIASADINDRTLLDNLKIGGLGLVNVYLRWTMYCRKGSLFEIGNTEEGHHAYVRIGRKTDPGEKDTDGADGLKTEQSAENGL